MTTITSTTINGVTLDTTLRLGKPNILSNWRARQVFENRRESGDGVQTAYNIAKLAYHYHTLDWDDNKNGCGEHCEYEQDGITVKIRWATDDEYFDRWAQGKFSDSWAPGALVSSELNDKFYVDRYTRQLAYGGPKVGHFRKPRRLQRRKHDNNGAEAWGLYRLDTGRYWIPDKGEDVATVAKYFRRYYGRHEAWLRALKQVREQEQYAVSDDIVNYGVRVRLYRDGVLLVEESSYTDMDSRLGNFWVMDTADDVLAEAWSNLAAALKAKEAELLATLGVVQAQLNITKAGK